MGFANWAIQKAANAIPLVQRICTVQSVNLDSDKREFAAEVVLKGETFSTSIVAEYDVCGNTIVLRSLKECSRPWMKAVADFYIANYPENCSISLENPVFATIAKFML